MLIATALVMLMSLPGLAIFYGGLAMVFTAYAIASVV
jgi:ammonia channel protein AmtB